MYERLRGTATVLASALVMAAISLAGQTPSTAKPGVASKPSWTAPRTPWGDPDLQGVFTTDDELGVPLERPAEFGTREILTDQEFAARAAQSERAAEADREEFVGPRAGRGGRAGGGGEGAGGTGPPGHWLERGKPSRRSSFIIDPPDGRIPYLSPEARKKGLAASARTVTAGNPFSGPEDLDYYDRCITRGLPHVIFPTIYNNTTHIVQGPGYVAISYEMIHDARTIALDGSPHVSPHIKMYFGDSRGRWEGDTLVVDVTNFTAKPGYRGAGEKLHIVERFRRIDADTIRYEVTVEDATIFARPWTAALHLKRDARQLGIPEYACHEGNYAMSNILSGARADERKAEKK